MEVATADKAGPMTIHLAHYLLKKCADANLKQSRCASLEESVAILTMPCAAPTATHAGPLGSAMEAQAMANAAAQFQKSVRLSGAPSNASQTLTENVETTAAIAASLGSSATRMARPSIADAETGGEIEPLLSTYELLTN